jgi:hypothetical protein
VARGAAAPLVAERLTAQRLSGSPAGDPYEVTSHLLAVQAQDARGARLAVRARTQGLTAADVDHALTGERSLVISWFCRGTLHLVTREDYHWLHALTTPPLATGCARRLAQEGVPPADADRAVAAIARALAADGPLTRAQLGERVAATGVRTEGQALVHILFLATLRGLIVRGPMIGKQHAYVLVRDWLGPAPAPIDRGAALAELARRYLTGHWPATDRDLARWAGLPLRDARAGLASIAAELGERRDGLLAPASAPPAAPLPSPRLLGPWDPASVGWTDRSWLNGALDGAVVTGGLFRPFALVDGRAVAIWQLRDRRVAIEPLQRIAKRDQAALAADAVLLERYLGGRDRA